MMPCGAVSVNFLTYMDIDLLAKMVGELILDNDEVSLPGVGTFVAEVMPSSFSDKGYTINPPYRKLSFRQREKSDGLLAALYARAYGVDVQTASSILEKLLLLTLASIFPPTIRVAKIWSLVDNVVFVFIIIQ